MSSRLGKAAASGLLCAVATAVLGQDAAAGAAKAVACAPCHGVDGNPSVGNFPVLAGQNFRYLYLQLRDFKDGRRRDPTMDLIAAKLSREDMLDLAAHFAARKPAPTGFKPDPARAARGREKAAAALCSMCHLAEFRGQNEIPRVAGQHYEYVVKQLRDFRAHRRTNDAGNMTAVARSLSDQDIEDLAHYIGGLQ